MYSKPCIVSDYGYTKLSSLINAVPHVARIIGSGPEKVVIAVEKSIPERVCSGQCVKVEVSVHVASTFVTIIHFPRLIFRLQFP